jgi:hypothetical protein
MFGRAGATTHGPTEKKAFKPSVIYNSVAFFALIMSDRNLQTDLVEHSLTHLPCFIIILLI